MIFTDFLRSVSQLGDHRFRSVLLRGVGLTGLLFVAIYWLFVTAVGWLIGDSLTLPWLGQIEWIDEALSLAAIPVMLMMSVVLMVPVASAIISLFLDEVAQAVEDRHYPDAGPARSVPLTETMRDSLGFLGVLIVANLFALLLYLIFAPFSPLIFWGLNGYLLGREYFTMAATRRLGQNGARQLRKKHALAIWGAGVVIAVPLTIPLVNLFVPILGAATFTHFFHRVARQA